ncbi:Kelch domain-containing protein 10 [Thelohanellus kitauei]|uniref:Kelch domain-containing protein 10 n=1 Tax=Thelohanellus kitauei TaxID=669202 RepID=A0A0C2JD24_THEKT|nr:Kelch domain-containing protein 10 [Thelohanellus kitauei]
MDVGNCISAPKLLNGLSMTSIGRSLIIYGGYMKDDGRLGGGLLSYDTISGIWREYKTYHYTDEYFYFASIIANGNLVYIFGGTDLEDYHPYTNSLVSYDFRNGTLQTLFHETHDCDENTPPPMSNSCIFYHNTCIYVLGGIYDDVHVNTMYKFCLSTSTWSLVPQNGQKPLLTGNTFGTIFNNRFYLFGDSSVTGPNGFRDAMIFDFSTNTWTIMKTSSKIEQYPEDRIEESFAFSSNLGYLVGGKKADTIYTDIWRIDLETLEWVKLEYSTHTGLDISCTSIVDNCYLFSAEGCDYDSGLLKVFERFTIQPPTLYQLSLESLKRSPNLGINGISLPPSIMDELNLNAKDSSSK